MSGVLRFLVLKGRKRVSFFYTLLLSYLNFFHDMLGIGV